MTDEALYAAYVNGDDAAFALLDARYRAPLTKYAMKLAGCQHADGENIAQRVLGCAATYRKSIGEHFVRPWLYAIATQRCEEWRTAVKLDARRRASPELEVMAEVYVK